MPNGGPDCCGNCSHNRAVQEMAHPHPEQGKMFWDLSYCTLRNIKITNPFWTYCDNFDYGKRPETRNQDEQPIGHVTASGLYEGYVRIPWNGIIEPQVSVPATCSICKRRTDQGIKINHNGKNIGFCTNRHYVEWWASINGDHVYEPENYETPEERFKNLANQSFFSKIKSFLTDLRFLFNN